jgi:hypothetical protein
LFARVFVATQVARLLSGSDSLASASPTDLVTPLRAKEQ